MKKRTIIIGDVHGCLQELKCLIKKINYEPEQDRLLFVGDLIHRGPNSVGCYNFLTSCGAESVRGNHEHSHILNASGDPRYAGRELKKLQKEFGEQYTTFIQDIFTWPTLIEEKDFILVHAGMTPYRKIHDSLLKDRLYIRDWQNPAEPHARSQPWFNYYHGEKTIVFGHWAKLGGIVRPNLIGLDAGCVYGGSLRAVIFPERQIVEQESFQSK